MTLVVYDRVQETTATTGTGTITLAGAVAGYQSFAIVGNGNTTYYCIINGSQWEVGLGTYSSTGPTLARTTVLSNSNYNTSPITLVGASNVFVTYPSEKSVNLNADGELDLHQVGSAVDINVLGGNLTYSSVTGALFVTPGAVISGGSTSQNVIEFDDLKLIGGTGTVAVQVTDTANSLTHTSTFDVNGNLNINNFIAGALATTAAGGTTVLTAASPRTQILVGSTTQTFQLPNATTVGLGHSFIFVNNSSGLLTVTNNAGTTVETVPSGGITQLGAVSVSTSAGSWGAYSFIPAAVNWGTNSLALASTVISGGTWQGGTIASGYGGTGLTTFTAANNALYSTSSSALTAGTLPVPAGGTGLTSVTAGYIPYGNGTSPLTTSAGLQYTTYLVVGGTTPLSGATNPIAAFSSTANNYVQTYTYNASTGTSASADYVAYANNSIDSSGWADLGYTSSTYADAVYSVTGPNEAYLFGSAPASSGTTGNFVYATDATGTTNAHQWYVGGFTQAKGSWKMQLTSTGLQLANALAVTYGGTGTATAAVNTVFAGPASGGTAAPSFRALVAADIPSTYSQFAAGTALLFYQAAAPTGWTKSTTNDNKALRVVSGATGGSSGGSVAFTTAFASQTPAGSVSTSISAVAGSVSTSITGISGTTTISGGVGNTSLTTDQLPSHTHSFSANTGGQSVNHTHNWGNQTGGQSANHIHGWSNSIPVAANQAFLLGSGGQVTYGDTSGVSTTAGNNADHSHYVSGATGGYSADHSHGVSGTTGGTGSTLSHTHTFSSTGAFSFSSGTASSSFTFSSGTASSAFTGTAINLAVQYIDVIVCTKN